MIPKTVVIKKLDDKQRRGKGQGRGKGKRKREVKVQYYSISGKAPYVKNVEKKGR